MHLPTHFTASLLALLVLVAGALRAQQPCSVAPVLRMPSAPQIFDPQQERALGDVEADWVEANYSI
ncbi:MAG: hypothetical protein WBQ89_08750, partial [Candidatus Acidiferrum sp.]